MVSRLSAAYCGFISQVSFAEHYSDYFIKISGYYHSADIIAFSLSQSDHIKRLPLYNEPFFYKSLK